MEISEGDMITLEDNKGIVRVLLVEEVDFDGEDTPLLWCIDSDGQDYSLVIDDYPSFLQVSRYGVLS